MAPAVVTIAGTKGSVNVEPAEGATVNDALVEAATILGIDNAKLGNLTPVVNGEEATHETPVQSGDRITAAPAVANG